MNFLLRKIRAFFWTFQSLFKRHKKLIISGFFFGLCTAFIIWKSFPVLKNILPRERKISGIVGLFEPGNLPVSIQKKISFGLTDTAENGEAIPAIAAVWKTDQDGKRYFFYLQKDLFWHDGEPFTAYDVNYNFKDVFINAADKNTLKIELADKFSPLPTLLSKPLFKKGLVGLGEYKVLNIRLKEGRVERLILKPSANNSSLPLLEYRFFPDTKSAVTAFKLGELDTVEGMFLNKYLEEENNIKIAEEAQTNWVLTIFFNLQRDLLSDKDARQALSYAAPNLEGKAVYSPIAESSWAYNGQVKQYKFNLDLAKNMMGNDEEIASASAELNLFTFPEYVNEAQKIAENWNSLGLKTTVRVTYVLPSEFDAFLGLLEIPPDPDQYQLWHSTQDKTNISSYQNPKIDKLLEDGRKTTSTEERIKIYGDFQRYLLDDAPAKFLVNPILYTVSRR